MKEKIKEMVREYIATDEAYDDNAAIAVNPSTGEVLLMDGEEAEELSDDYTVTSAMDLVRMDSNGAWTIDDDAITDFVTTL